MSGVTLCLFSIIVLFGIIPWQIEEAPPGFISPRLVPQLMMMTVAVLSCLQVVNAWRQQASNDVWPISKSEILALVKILGAFAIGIVLYLFGNPLLAAIGLVVSALIFLEERRVWLILLLPMVLITGVWLLFYKVLGTAIV